MGKRERRRRREGQSRGELSRREFEALDPAGQLRYQARSWLDNPDVYDWSWLDHTPVEDLDRVLEQHPPHDASAFASLLLAVANAARTGDGITIIDGHATFEWEQYQASDAGRDDDASREWIDNGNAALPGWLTVIVRPDVKEVLEWADAGFDPSAADQHAQGVIYELPDIDAQTLQTAQAARQHDQQEIAERRRRTGR